MWYDQHQSEVIKGTRMIHFHPLLQFDRSLVAKNFLSYFFDTKCYVTII